MDEETNRRLLQAARALMRLDGATFATRLGVSLTTIRRIEAGAKVKAGTMDAILNNLAAIGVVVIADMRIDGRDLVAGVGFTKEAQIGPEPYLSAHAKPGSRSKRPRRPADDDVADADARGPERDAGDGKP